jgi:hypothetical protein
MFAPAATTSLIPQAVPSGVAKSAQVSPAPRGDAAATSRAHVLLGFVRAVVSPGRVGEAPTPRTAER